MGKLFDELSESLNPHVQKMHEMFNFHGFLLQERLARIENAIGTQGRPDIGDLWFKQVIKGKLALGETEFFTVDLNEYNAVQYITINGLTAKSPAFTITAGGAMVLAFAKEGVGQETIGGDIMFLPGERISIVTAEAGTFEITLGLTRIMIDKQGNVVQYGRSEELLATRNTHDPNRDVIMSRTGLWTEDPSEVEDTGGRPVITR